jgi:lysophospholipase L1-like esterase
MRFIIIVLLECFLAIILSLFSCSQLNAAKIVSTGDSLTGLYSAYMPADLSVYGMYEYPNPAIGKGGSDTQYGGIGSAAFVGLRGDPLGNGPVNYAANCVAASPDVVLYMLGINDCYNDQDKISGPGNNNYNFNCYKTRIHSVFQTWAAQPFKVVIGSITPVNDPVAAIARGLDNQHANDRIDQYNAWLRQEASDFGFLYLDTAEMMELTPNWENVMLGSDGLHYSTYGASWISEKFAQAAAILAQDNAIVSTDILVGDLNVHNLRVTGNLSATSLIADSLTIENPAQTVPEPSTLVLALLGLTLGGAIFFRRK